MRDPLALLEPYPLRAEALLLPPALRLRPGDRLRLRIPAVGEVPDALLAATTDDGDLTARVQHAEHEPHLPCAPPPVRLALRRCVVFDLARQERSALLELAH